MLYQILDACNGKEVNFEMKLAYLFFFFLILVYQAALNTGTALVCKSLSRAVLHHFNKINAFSITLEQSSDLKLIELGEIKNLKFKNSKIQKSKFNFYFKFINLFESNFNKVTL